VSLGGANLFFDQIEVVEQPLAGRRDPAVRRDRRHEQRQTSIRVRFVLGQPRQKLVRRLSWRQLMRGRETLAVLFHLDGAEQFRAQRRLVADTRLSLTAMFASALNSVGQAPTLFSAECALPSRTGLSADAAIRGTLCGFPK
jgi:hypothetical protein